MKDLPHHIKKLNRKVIRSLHRDELAEETYDLITPPPPSRKQTERQRKKQAKARERKEKEAHAPVPLTPEEQNKKMKHRVPVFEKINNALPRYTKPTRKKAPRM